MRTATKYIHLSFGLIVFATVAILDWMLDASDYPQG